MSRIPEFAWGQSSTSGCSYKHCLPDGASRKDAAHVGIYLVTAAVDRSEGQASALHLAELTRKLQA